MTQWHPIFSHLLRAVLQDYYEVQTNVPVGDLPREADIILLRRAGKTKPPFRTLWSHLTRWNVLEFKGRTESARVEDIDLLIEVGLGIQRRLQEKDKSRVARAEVSFWYSANHLGKRFLRDVIELTGELTPVAAGLWRGSIVGRPLWLLSNRDVMADLESAAVRIVSEQSVGELTELARVVVSSEDSWRTFGPWLAFVGPAKWKEICEMARKRKRGDIDAGSIFRTFCELLEDAGPERLKKEDAPRKMLEMIGLDAYLAVLSPEQREEAVRQMQSRPK